MFKLLSPFMYRFVDCVTFYFVTNYVAGKYITNNTVLSINNTDLTFLTDCNILIPSLFVTRNHRRNVRG